MSDVHALPLNYSNDVIAKHDVQIQVRHDGLVVWINVDGICVNRIITNGFVPIEIEDDRGK